MPGKWIVPVSRQLHAVTDAVGKGEQKRRIFFVYNLTVCCLFASLKALWVFFSV